MKRRKKTVYYEQSTDILLFDCTIIYELMLPLHYTALLHRSNIACKCKQLLISFQ